MNDPKRYAFVDFFGVAVLKVLDFITPDPELIPSHSCKWEKDWHSCRACGQDQIEARGMRANLMTILEWVEWEIHVTEAFLNPYVRPEPEITRELVELWRLDAREAVIPDAAPGVGLAACRCFEGDYDTDCPAAKTVN